MSSKTNEPRPSFPGQHGDEAVKLVFRQHPVVLRKQLIYGMLLILLAVVPFDIPQIYMIDWLPGVLLKVSLVVVACILLFWFREWVGWYYSIYILTDRRIISIRQKGFFDRTVQEWQLDKIYNVNYHIAGFQAAIFGYGDIITKTVIGEFVMPTVQKPIEIHRQILMAVKDARPDSATIIDNQSALM